MNYKKLLGTLEIKTQVIELEQRYGIDSINIESEPYEGKTSRVSDIIPYYSPPLFMDLCFSLLTITIQKKSITPEFIEFMKIHAETLVGRKGYDTIPRMLIKVAKPCKYKELQEKWILHDCEIAAMKIGSLDESGEPTSYTIGFNPKMMEYHH